MSKQPEPEMTLKAQQALTEASALLRTHWLERWALYSPNKTAVKDDMSGTSYTYSEMSAHVNRISRILADTYSVGRGDRIAVLSQNCVEYLFLYFAVQLIGAIIVPVNYRLAPREVSYILRDSTAKLLVLQEYYRSVYDALDADARPATIIGMDAEQGHSIRSFMHTVTVSTSALPDDARFDDPCMILYTSGTTGNPKGALITNGMVFWNSINTELRLNITSNDVCLSFAPFFHTGGWHVLNTPFLHHGATIVLMNGFQADRIVELCDRERVTILFGVPTMMRMMSQTAAFASASFDTVRFAIVGGEPMPIPEIELWQSKGVPIRQGFGLTEVGPNCFSLPEEDAIRKKGSIGFPNFYIDARIVDDHGNDCAEDEPGELLLRSPVVTPGYWNNPKATAEAISDGWFHTGDIVRRDAEGYFYVVDRKKDMFISGAENVYPAEVERCLYEHPAIAEAAVIGVPDAKWGEVGRAFLVLRSGAVPPPEEDFRTHCISRLAKYKVPKYFTIIPELPKGHSGKILKRALNELYPQP